MPLPGSPPLSELATARGDLLPSLGLACGAAAWGLYWIPVRAIEQGGVDGIWTGPVVFAASLVFLLPYMLFRLGHLLRNWRGILLPGLLSGAAFALYIASLNTTEVVRAILLFYMSPLWSTLLGIVILREQLTANRACALLLAFGGLYVVLVVDSGLPVPRNAGDWYALASGLCWSVASVKLFQGGARNLPEKVSIFIVCALLVSVAMVFWEQGDTRHMPGWAELQPSLYWLLAIAILQLPVTFLTIWPATLLSPARVGMLLLMEVLVGVVSAALLIDEPFGLREIAGAALIVSAGVVEVMRRQTVVPGAATGA